MTNTQIIISEAIANGIYTKEEVDAILESGRMIPVHTFQTWKSAGYIVRKGEHAKITTRLWKFTNKKAGEADGDADGEANNHYYLAKAFLFTADQVEKIATA
ncbi:hypothetical protein IMSAGC013_03021 [Lachnospiraceae bacterium]|nr:hypothetical protein IMSAGC013_03021 [Lachnospiraceae bacterium]